MSMDVKTLTAGLKGKFVVFDGPDGCGKSTQSRLLVERLQEAGARVVICRDPGGTEIGDRIRSVLLDHDLSAMDVNCEVLLFMASRAQLVFEVIRPALAQGQTVVCDRFVSSTCAYQGAAGYDPRQAIELAHLAIGDCWPDVTMILDVDVDQGFARIGRKPQYAGKHGKRSSGQLNLSEDIRRPDAMEARSIDFHRRVRRLFLEVHRYYPRPVVTVDGRGDVEAVHTRVMEALAGVIS